MKRIVALLLMLGILAVAAPMRADKDDKKDDKKTEEKKKDDKKKDDKKVDKKKDDKKKDDKKVEKKSEAKLTPEQKRDLERISGTFNVILFEHDGKKWSSDDLKKLKVKQKGAEWSFQSGDEITEGKDTVFPDKKPKQIDSIYVTGPARDKKVLGIYEISNESVKYCWADPDKERPTEFATKPGSGLTLMILEREKPDEKGSESKKVKEKDKEKGKEKEKTKDKEKDKG